MNDSLCVIWASAPIAFPMQHLSMCLCLSVVDWLTAWSQSTNLRLRDLENSWEKVAYWTLQVALATPKPISTQFSGQVSSELACYMYMHVTSLELCSGIATIVSTLPRETLMLAEMWVKLLLNPINPLLITNITNCQLLEHLDFIFAS